jgi:hypothetical protein
VLFVERRASPPGIVNYGTGEGARRSTVQLELIGTRGKDEQQLELRLQSPRFRAEPIANR